MLALAFEDPQLVEAEVRPRPRCLEHTKALALVGPLAAMPTFLGALTALEEHGLTSAAWKHLNGCSGGALIAVGLAYGYSAANLSKRLVDARPEEWASRPGSSSTGQMQRWIERLGSAWHPTGATFAELRDSADITLEIAATQLYRVGQSQLGQAGRTEGSSYVFQSLVSPDVSLAEAAAASAAMPGLFRSAKVGEYRFIDGSLSHQGAILTGFNADEALVLRTRCANGAPHLKRGTYDVDLVEMLRALALLTTEANLDIPITPDRFRSRTIDFTIYDDPLNLAQPAERIERQMASAYEATLGWLEFQETRQ